MLTLQSHTCISNCRTIESAGSGADQGFTERFGLNISQFYTPVIQRIFEKLGRSTLFVLMATASVSGLSGCAKSSFDSQAPLSVSQGSAYATSEIMALANELVATLEMPSDKQGKLLEKLERILNDSNFRPKIYQDAQKIGVTGVFSYRLGEGGAVLTFKSGRAIARIKGRSTAERYRLSGADLGAQLAASREWGIGLIFGLREGESFAGNYRGLQRSAAIVAGPGTATMNPKRGNHKIVLVGSGSGVSLDVSGSQLKIKQEK